mmetsp:Transcript_67366/g.173441  ORF Transcript_67366/g.173441 Transcript_67366/m.173441 type:complete len:247 (-) Transcript_67366:67-807(-)
MFCAHSSCWMRMCSSSSIGMPMDSAPNPTSGLPPHSWVNAYLTSQSASSSSPAAGSGSSSPHPRIETRWINSTKRASFSSCEREGSGCSTRNSRSEKDNRREGNRVISLGVLRVTDPLSAAALLGAGDAPPGCVWALMRPSPLGRPKSAATSAWVKEAWWLPTPESLDASVLTIPNVVRPAPSLEPLWRPASWRVGPCARSCAKGKGVTPVSLELLPLPNGGDSPALPRLSRWQVFRGEVAFKGSL